MAKILLIEDTVDLDGIIRRELERNGYAVLVEHDGEKGMLTFHAEYPDLVILDWMLGKMSGLDVLRQIRSLSAVSVLMLTARGDLADRVAGLELGADDYLVKPFDLPELLARIHALLRRSRQDQQILTQDHASGHGYLTWRGITLSSVEHVCTCDDKPIDLTRLEFDLLELLMKNPGRVFNRNYLYETVWDQPYIEGDRSIDNTIMRMRKKMGAYSEYLETIREVGFRLKAD